MCRAAGQQNTRTPGWCCSQGVQISRTTGLQDIMVTMACRTAEHHGRHTVLESWCPAGLHAFHPGVLVFCCPAALHTMATTLSWSPGVLLVCTPWPPCCPGVLVSCWPAHLGLPHHPGVLVFCWSARHGRHAVLESLCPAGLHTMAAMLSRSPAGLYAFMPWPHAILM